ncbi:MAG: 3-keto-5-aminohexanoate cleavage protein [Spirochaetales bacterium]|uniref:3-keto-5-aminohexanoate cleavage protein n=1 Tax=Candidatus Thalassospirochaeta sargassi TaxID=3119039 RepID=A0AAJ1IHY2_9SPIO|nr:3-keto-5-aminohexanoate cleavage protein [Spirochaetales bacterium]
MSDLADKVIITVAPTGAWPSKKDNPNVPLTPSEIAADVIACWKAGASVAHLHMRDDEGLGTMDKVKFKETVERIRDNSDIVLNLTTSGDLNATEETRMAHLIELKPELASFDCGSMNWMHSGLFLNPPKFLEKLATVMKENGVKPEIEVFDAGMLYNALYYLKKGFLEAPLHFQFVLGAAGGTAATVENLVYLKSLLPEGATWSALGIGKGHLPVMLSTIALDGHVRVGMEDNVVYAKGQLAESNSQFVERTVRLVKEANKQNATPEEARQLLGLKAAVNA